MDEKKKPLSLQDHKAIRAFWARKAERAISVAEHSVWFDPILIKLQEFLTVERFWPHQTIWRDPRDGYAFSGLLTEGTTVKDTLRRIAQILHGYHYRMNTLSKDEGSVSFDYKVMAPLDNDEDANFKVVIHYSSNTTCRLVKIDEEVVERAPQYSDLVSILTAHKIDIPDTIPAVKPIYDVVCEEGEEE